MIGWGKPPPRAGLSQAQGSMARPEPWWPDRLKPLRAQVHLRLQPQRFQASTAPNRYDDDDKAEGSGAWLDAPCTRRGTESEPGSKPAQAPE